MAAKLRRELQIEVDTVHGSYGEYKILVDGETVIDGGRWVALGIVPPSRKTVNAVREKLGL